MIALCNPDLALRGELEPAQDGVQKHIRQRKAGRCPCAILSQLSFNKP